MNLAEYASYDALGLAELVARKEVTPQGAGALGGRGQGEGRRRRQRCGGALSRPHRWPRRGEPRQRPVPRRAVSDQGCVRPREGAQNRVRLAPVRGHDRGGRHLLRRSAQGRRRQHPRPLGGARVFDVGHHRERAPRQHVESLETGLLGRRLHRRRHGGRHRRHRAHRARLRHRRLHPHPGLLVRRRRPQALAHARLHRPGGGRGRLGLLHELRADQDRARRRRHARLRVHPAARRPLHHPQAGRALRHARHQVAGQAEGGHRARQAAGHRGRSGGRPGGAGRRQGASPTWATRSRWRRWRSTARPWCAPPPTSFSSASTPGSTPTPGAAATRSAPIRWSP